MANEQNLKPGGYKLTVEEQKKGGIASGKARREKALLKKSIQWLLEESDIRITKGPIYETYKAQGIDISQLTPSQLVTIGLWGGAVTGKAENYKTLMAGTGELQGIIEENQTPDVTINVIDNSKLEKVLYEDND